MGRNGNVRELSHFSYPHLRWPAHHRSMERTDEPDTPALDKRTLGLARLEATQRRLALIRKRVLAAGAMLLIAAWGFVLAQSWNPLEQTATAAPQQVLPQAAYDDDEYEDEDQGEDDDEDEDEGLLAPATAPSTSPAPAPAPAPAPVTSSQS